MLILNKPVYCKCSRNILTLSNNLAERIEAFYRLLSVKVDEQELLHMVTAPPDIYMEEAGFTHVAEAPDSQNPGQLKLEVLSQLLNRILLFASGGSTYQDRVYITVVLRKLGIKNVAGFMKQMQSYFEKTDRIWQLTGKPLDYAADVKHQNKQGAGTHGGRENEQKRESLEGKGQELPEEGILTLHQTIFTRLQTEQIYHEIQNIYRTYPAAFRRIAKEELQVYEQGRLAQRIQYNKLANRVLKDRLPVFYGSQNPYETAEEMQESGPEKTADYGLAAAVLTNLVQAVYEVRPQYRRQTGRPFLSLEHSFWHSADNTLARFRIACKEKNGMFYGSWETDSLVLQEVSIVEKLLRLEKDIMQAKADDSREKDVMQAKENDSREKDVVQAWENDSQVKDIKQVWENSSHKESILQGLREKGRKCRLMYRQQGRLIPEAVKAGEDLMKKTASGRTEQKPQQKIQKQHTELAFKTKELALRPTEKQLHHEGKPQQQGTEPGPKGEVQEQYHIKPEAEPSEANLHPGEPASGAPEKEQYDRKQKQEPPEIRLHHRERESGLSETELHQREHTSRPPETEQYQRERTSGPPETEQYQRERTSGPPETEQYQREHTSEPPEAELYHRERASESSEEEQYHIKPAADPPEMILHQRERGTGPSETELYYREPVTEIPDTMLHHGEVSHGLLHRKTQRKVSKSDSGFQEKQESQHEGAQIQYRQVTGKQSAMEESIGENTAMKQERQPKVFWQEHRNRTESAATEKRMREFQKMLAPETIKIFDTLREYGSNPEKLVQEGIVTRNPEKLLLLNLLQQKQDTRTQTETGAGEPRLLHKQPVSLRQEEYLEEIRIRSREMKRLAEEAEKAVQKRQSQSGASEQETQRAIRRIAEQAEQKMKQQLGSISEQVYAALERKLESEQRRRGL